MSTSPDSSVTVVITESPRGLKKTLRHAASKALARPRIALWQFVRVAIALTYFWIGGTYLFGHDHVVIDPALHLLTNVEPGGARVHGLILCALAFAVASRPVFKQQTVYALLATLFYSLATAALIVGGWVLHKPDLAAPAWYLLIAALSFALILSASTSQTRSRRGG